MSSNDTLQRQEDRVQDSEGEEVVRRDLLRWNRSVPDLHCRLSERRAFERCGEAKGPGFGIEVIGLHVASVGTRHSEIFRAGLQRSFVVGVDFLTFATCSVPDVAFLTFDWETRQSRET